MTTVDGAPMTVSLSLWQWMKAGIGFTFGAALASAVVGFVAFIVWFSVLSAMARILLSR